MPRNWGGNREVHFWWESPVLAVILLGGMGLIAVAIR